MIDREGYDRLLLRNPSNYKAGFWTTFVFEGRPHAISSTEPASKMVMSAIKEQGSVHITGEYNSRERNPLVRVEDILWSKNVPVLLWRHGVRNTTDQVIKDLRMYLLMDFDLGGPRSYKDDMARYQPETGIMTVWDKTDLFAQIGSMPKPDSWDVSTPVKLTINETIRDLNKNLEIGPRDIVVGLQWNLDDVQPNDKASIDVLLSAGTSLEEVSDSMNGSWNLFDKKMQ
ncbi:MAG: hypothetical protein ACFFEF_01270 [Candidatus Thorarchaeota archaeon]